jgi:hypothetical protein
VTVAAATAADLPERFLSVGARSLHFVVMVTASSEFRPIGDIPRADGRFRMVSDYQPAGDQPAAIDELQRRIEAGEKDVVLLGATGTGKSATTAWLIERLQRPTLLIAPNKTLAAQLANELREFFPDNAVEYFVSYYDYYQPEAYVPQTDTYIEKDSRSTRTSSGCGTRPRGACCRGATSWWSRRCRASTAWAARRSTSTAPSR